MFNEPETTQAVIDFTEIIKTVLTGVGGAGALYLGYLFDKWRKGENPHATSNGRPLQLLDATAGTPDLLAELFETTETVDRIICLRAYGEKSYETIKVWDAQARREESETINPKLEYNGIETDRYYRSMLEHVESEAVWITVARMDRCQLRRFYKTEGITESFVDRLCVLKTIEGWQIVYFSVATRSPAGFTGQDKDRIETAAQRARHLFKYVGQ